MDKRVRSPNYPALSLPDAVLKVKGVYSALHNHAGPREVIAKAMGFSGLNGASATAISALHKYGLLDRVGVEEIKVSERAMQIIAPQSPDERAGALRTAAASPALFAEIAEKFPGSAPNDDLLRNYLIRKGFASGALSAVITAYRETSDMVEREGGGYDSSADHNEGPTEMQMETTSTRMAAPPTVPVSPTIFGGERPIGRYDYEGGGYVRIAVSGAIDTKEALDMVEILISLKRKELERTKEKTNAPGDDLDVTAAN